MLEKPLSLKEIAEIFEIKDKKAYSLLKNMFQNNRVVSFKDTDGSRRYRITEKEREKALKRKAREEKKAAKAAK